MLLCVCMCFFSGWSQILDNRPFPSARSWEKDGQNKKWEGITGMERQGQERSGCALVDLWLSGQSLSITDSDNEFKRPSRWLNSTTITTLHNTAALCWHAANHAKLTQPPLINTYPQTRSLSIIRLDLKHKGGKKNCKLFESPAVA